MDQPVFDDATVQDLPRELSEAWDATGVDPRRVTIVGSGTLAPPDWADGAMLDSEDEELTATSFDTNSTGALILGNVLGRGGSGVVRLAQQPALSRDVAIKQLSASADSPRARRRLLREARATGALEHPNIIPVHDLGNDENGRPMIVMKRVEGTAWTEHLRRPASLTDEWLAEHVEILIEVAQAVDFAHERGVLHRDLKPDNVMLGKWGEVYVVDWGIAVALPACTIPGLPKAADVKDVFGTPSYMSPEMVTAEAELIGVRSDVYLLGALLFRIVCGAPPHRAPNVPQMLLKAFKSEIKPFPDDVPEALQAICRRAMGRHPDERYQSAAAFAAALEDYLKHRHSVALTREGLQRLDELKELLTRAQHEDVTTAAGARYRECRFAFEQARRIWSGNTAAADALAEAAEQMIALELAAGRPDAARALLDDLERPAPDLVARVDKASAEVRQHAEELEAFAAEHDLAATDRARSIAAVLLTLGSVTVNLVCGWLNRRDPAPLSHLIYAGAYGLNLLYGVGIIIALREGVWGNLRNRQISLTSMLTLVSHMVLLLTCYAIGVSLADAMVLMAVAMALIWVGGTYALDRRMWPLPASCAIEAVVVAKMPVWAFEVRAASVTISLLLLAFVWARSSVRSPLGEG